MIRGVRNYSSVTPAPARRILRELFCDHIETVSMGGIPCDGAGIPVDTVPKSLTFCRHCGKLLIAQPLEEMMAREAERGY